METIIEITDNFELKRKIIRPEVAMFALEMEKTLMDNDYKTGWDKLSIHALYTHLQQEFDELREEYIVMNHHLGDDREYIQNIHNEAIDIANFCMFLCHNYPKDKESAHHGSQGDNGWMI